VADEEQERRKKAFPDFYVVLLSASLAGGAGNVGVSYLGGNDADYITRDELIRVEEQLRREIEHTDREMRERCEALRAALEELKKIVTDHNTGAEGWKRRIILYEQIVRHCCPNNARFSSPPNSEIH